MSTLDLSLTKPATTYVKIASNMDTGQSVEPYLSLPQQDVIPGFVVESLRDQIICSPRAVKLYVSGAVFIVDHK